MAGAAMTRVPQQVDKANQLQITTETQNSLASDSCVLAALTGGVAIAARHKGASAWAQSLQLKRAVGSDRLWQ